jgi:hypothetical protein
MDKQKMLKQITQMSAAIEDIRKMCYSLCKDKKNEKIYNKVLSYSNQCQSKLKECTGLVNTLDSKVKECHKIIDAATKEVKNIK